MRVLCGTDLSPHSLEAGRAAAALAAASGGHLLLVHVLGPWPGSPWPEGLAAQARAHVAERLEEAASRLRSPSLEVEVRLAEGQPDEALAEVAAETDVDLVVVGALGHRSEARWRVGSVASRLLRTCPKPVLVVHGAEAFVAGTSGARALRVLVGVDLSLSADAAVRWTNELAGIGAAEVTWLHLWEPHEARLRLGIESPAHDDAEIEARLEQEIALRFGDRATRAGVRTVLRRRHASVAAELLQEAPRFDLLVVGSHPSTGMRRLWQGSLAQEVLASSAVAVATIPAAYELDERLREIPSPATVLAPTDGSPAGNAAVRWAHAVAAPGGTVHVLYVSEDPPAPNPLYAHYDGVRRESPKDRSLREAEIERSLRRRLEPRSQERDVTTRIHIARGEDPVTVICRTAAELGADVICIGTRGRSAFATALLGSVATGVAERAGRPVLLVRATDDG